MEKLPSDAGKDVEMFACGFDTMNVKVMHVSSDIPTIEGALRCLPYASLHAAVIRFYICIGNPL